LDIYTCVSILCVVISSHLFRNCYVLEGVLTERPLSSSPFEIEGGYRIQDCILDTAITLEDVVSGETLFHTRITEDTDDFIEFALEDVGQYQVTVASPLPHLETVMILSKD